MEKMPLGKQTFGVMEPSSFIAWIILPPGIDRTSYIKKCYQTGSVLIKSVDQQIENYVQVDKTSINFIKFPLEGVNKGSAVVCVKDPLYRTSKIVAVLQDEDDDQLIFEENQFRIHKRNENNFVDVDIKGNTGELDITVNSETSGIENNFKFLSKNKNAKLKIVVQGDYETEVDNNYLIHAEKKFQITIIDNENNGEVESILTYEYGKGFTIQDQYSNLIQTSEGKIELKNKTGENIKLENTGLTIKSSEEDLKTILDDLFTQLISAIVTTPSGAGSFGPSTIEKLTEIKTRLTLLFS